LGFSSDRPAGALALRGAKPKSTRGMGSVRCKAPTDCRGGRGNKKKKKKAQEGREYLARKGGWGAKLGRAEVKFKSAVENNGHKQE